MNSAKTRIKNIENPEGSLNRFLHETERFSENHDTRHALFILFGNRNLKKDLTPVSLKNYNSIIKK